MRLLGKILKYVALVLLLLVFAAFASLQLPRVQTVITSRVVDILEENIDAQISLGHLSIKPFNSLVIRDLVIIDKYPKFPTERDTLIHIGNLDARFSLLSLIGPGHEDYIIRRLNIRNTTFNLGVESDNVYGNNIKRMFLRPRDYNLKNPIQRDIIRIDKIVAQNLNFNMQIFGRKISKKPENCVDFSDLQVSRIKIEARDFKMSHGIFTATVEHLSAREKCGFEITHASAEVTAGQGDARINNFVIEDNNSSRISMDARLLGHTRDFWKFISNVMLDINLNRSQIAQKTVAHFVPAFRPDGKDFFTVQGNISGMVNNAKLNNLSVALEKRGVMASLDASVKGLPDIRNANFDLNLGNCLFTTDDISYFARNVLRQAPSKDLSKYAKGKVFSFGARAKGTLDNIEGKLSLKQGKSYGSASLEFKAQKLMSDRKNAVISGSVQTEGLDLGTLAASEKLGPATVKADFSASLSPQLQDLTAQIHNLVISELEFNGYSYHDIDGNLEYIKSDIEANLHSADPNCEADLSIWSDKYSYNANFNIHNANLREMNIDKRDKSEIAMNIYGRLERGLEQIEGNASMTDIFLTNSEGTQKIGDITMIFSRREGVYDARVESDDLNASFVGNRKWMEAHFNTFNTSAILAYLLPNAYIDSGSSINISLSEDGAIDGNLSSRRLAFGDNYIKNLEGHISGNLKDLDSDITAEEINVKDIAINNNRMTICLVDKLAKVNYSFRNSDSTNGNLSLDAEFSEGRNCHVDIHPSDFFVHSDRWEIPKSAITLHGGDISVENLTLKSRDQYMNIDGLLSRENSGVLKAKIHNFDLSVISDMIKNLDLGLKGSMDMDAYIQSPYTGGTPHLEFNLQAADISAGGTDLGRFSAACQWDNQLEHYYISANQRIGGNDALMASAILNPSRKALDSSIALEKYPIDFVQPLFPTVFSKLKGWLSGQFFVGGPLKELDFSSRDARIDDGALTVAFTHAAYTAAGEIRMDNEGIHLDGLEAIDRKGAKALASGGLKWDRGKAMMLDMAFDVENFELMNIPHNSDNLFYGDVFCNGRVDFKGPFRALTMGLNVQSRPESVLHFNMSRNITAAKSDLLTFVDPTHTVIDPFEEHLNIVRDRKRRRSEFKVKMHADVNHDLSMNIDLGSNQFSSGVTADGNGIIDLDFNARTREYSILGDYVISEGRANINVSNLVRRTFLVQSGSSIKFNGLIFDSTVDIDADYETKASIGTIIGDADADNTRRIVQCGIHLKNSLKNPAIRFSVNVPDLNPSIKNSVESALGTEDKIQKQFLSLLISNNFLPDEQSSIINNSSMLFSNVSEIMASQVNNILNRLNIPLDLGLNYRPTEQGANLFDVAVSTQLFNNRVIIGGNFGNRQTLTSNSGTFFGDFDIQYKVLRSGSFRIKAFSHSADKYSNFLDNSQRNGIGLTWQQEFDTFPEWFKRLFSSKAVRQTLQMMDQAGIQKQTTIILDE